ncbi:MAG TPA: MASE3 domain-containing protein [Burkholderiaceae bacterium]|nr:MASE3 domain-containing protein [Burkholderiaceae bacterium]
MHRLLNNNNNIRQAHALILILAVISSAALLTASLTGFPSAALYQPFEVNIVPICFLLDALIFAVAWNRSGETLSRSAILLAVAFFCVALLQFFYIVSLPNMPVFLFENQAAKPVYFQLLSRLLVAISITAIAGASFRTIITRRKAVIVLLLALLCVLAYSYPVFIGWHMLPRLVTDGYQSSLLKSGIDYAILFLYVPACVQRYRELHHDTQKNTAGQFEAQGRLDRFNLFAATLSLLLAQICIILFNGTPSIVAFLGPVYKVIGTIFFYRCIVASNIKAPYAALARLARELETTSNALQQNQMLLTGIIQNASDAIITVDSRQVIVLANPSAAAMFGVTSDKMQGCPIEQYIPAQHHEKYRRHIRLFGKPRLAYLTKGKTYSHHAVTGLRANGEEFAIEASISSMMENDKQLYTLILRDITERKLVQDKLAQSHNELRRLSRALQTVREEERRNIARDLHDDLGQLLATLRIDLSLLQKQSAEAIVSPHQFDGMDTLLTTSITSLRRIATDLRPRGLDEGGLYFALQTLRKDFVTRYGIACELHADETQLVLDEQRTTAIYRIIQEALANIFRHANARKVVIAFMRDDATLEISIHDDGHGMRPEDMANTSTFGLADMRERVHAMDGSISITSLPSQGTRINIILPL